jgi:hypothetical protein
MSPVDTKIKSPDEMWATLRKALSELEAQGLSPMTINFDAGDMHYQRVPTLKIEFPYFPLKRALK